MNLYFALVADIRFLHEARFYPLIRWPKLVDHYKRFNTAIPLPINR